LFVILGIIAAMIIPIIGTFMTMGTVSAANSEAENVKTASLAYYADVQDWPDNTESASGNYTFTDYYAGTLKDKYYFNEHGFITSVSSPGVFDPDGTESSGYDGIIWEYPISGVASEGHEQWVRAEE
jgi:type II secretory pathway pseudopilin PulG